MKSQPSTCPECGGTLPAEAAFCPQCLLRGGLDLPDLDTSGYTTEHFMEGRESEGLESRLMGRYKLGSKLGEGGFGVVFEAKQMQPLQRPVAVKVLKAGMNAAQIIARFEAERQALAMMDHPGISRVLDAGETEDGRPFFVMERVEGVPVTPFVRQQNLPLPERLRLFISICEAVHHAHQKGVIHRDLKPSNILVSMENGVPRPRVIDFGLAKALEARLSKQAIYTLHDQVIGTPGYIGPEQIEHGAEAADVRGDVYALGALLYEILTGVAAVEQKSLIGKPLHEALREAATRPLIPPSQHDARLRGDLESIILKALSADPAQRYASADALALDVQRHLLDQPVLARPADRLYIASKFAKRNRLAVAAAAALLVAAITVAWSGVQKYQLEQRHQAERQRDSSRKYFQDARQYSERGRNGDAIVHLCQALRENPQNSTAATYLAALLCRHHLGHRVATGLELKPGWTQLRHLALSAAERCVIAVCSADEAARSDLLMRWKLDKNTGPAIDLGLPQGMKVTACVQSMDDRFLLLGFSDGALAVYDIGEGSFSQFMEKMQGTVSAITLDEAGAFACAGTDSGDVRLWDVAQQVPAAPVLKLSGSVKHIALDAKAQHAVVAFEHELIAFDPRSSQSPGTQRSMAEDGITSLSLNPPGTLCAAGLQSGKVLVLGAADLAPVGSPLMHRGAVVGLNFDPPGQVLVSGDDLGLVNVWQAQQTRPLRAGEQLGGAVILCRIMAERQQITAISARGELRVWQFDGTSVSAHQGQQLASAAAISHDGTLAALLSEKEPKLEVWELQSRMLEPRLWEGAVPDSAGIVASSSNLAGPALEISGDQLTFRTDQDRRVKVTDKHSGQQVCADLYHDTAVCHLALSADQRTLLSITVEGAHRAWDAQTGEPLMPAFKRGERARALRLHPSGQSYLYQRESGDAWYEMPLPVRVSSVPEWFLDFAEARATKRLRPDGTSISIPRERQRSIVDSQPAAAADYLTTLARWLMQPPTQRTAWPLAP